MSPTASASSMARSARSRNRRRTLRAPPPAAGRTSGHASIVRAGSPTHRAPPGPERPARAPRTCRGWRGISCFSSSVRAWTFARSAVVTADPSSSSPAGRAGTSRRAQRSLRRVLVHGRLERGPVSHQRAAAEQVPAGHVDEQLQRDRRAQARDGFLGLAGLEQHPAVQLVRIAGARCHAHGLAQLARTPEVIAEHPPQLRERRVRLTQVGCQCECLLGRLSREPLGLVGLLGLEIEREPANLSAGIAGEDRGVLGRQRDRLLEEPHGLAHVAAPSPVQGVPGAKVEIHGASVGRRDARGRAPLHRERLGDRVGHVVRDREHLLLRAVEALGPELEAVGHAHDARGDAYASRPPSAPSRRPRPARAARARSRAHPGRCRAQRGHRAAREHAQARRHRQGVDEIVGQPIGEVLVLGRPQVAERQHRDGLAVRVDGRGSRRRANGRSSRGCREGQRRRGRAATSAAVPKRSSRLAGHGPEHQLGHARRQVRTLHARIGRRVHEARGRDGPDAVPVPRALAGEAARRASPRARRRRRARRVRRALDLLGGHVRRRAQRHAHGDRAGGDPRARGRCRSR